MVAHIASSFKPLYFVVRQVKEVMSTEQPCDLAYEFGNGIWNLIEYPEGFPKPGKLPLSSVSSCGYPVHHSVGFSKSLLLV